MASIGRLTILVNDIDEAKAFYRDAFGFETLFDGEVAPGLRTAHVGPHGERGAGLWFLAATTEASRARVGAQTGGEPALVLYVDDLVAELRHLERLAVRVVKQPTRGDDASFAHLLDNSGNEIVLAQLPAAESRSAYALID